MRDHIKHGRVATYTGVPLPALDLITASATDAMDKENRLSGIFRVAVMDEVMLFASLVLFPREKGACNTQIREGSESPTNTLGRGEPRVTSGPCESF